MDNKETNFDELKKNISGIAEMAAATIKNVQKMMPKGEIKKIKFKGKEAKIYLGENGLMYIEFVNKGDEKIIFDSFK